MAQQFQVIVNTGKAQSAQIYNAEQGAGQRGRPLILKAQAGAKYQLVEVAKGQDWAPDNVKAKRVGKHLHLMFETDTQADVIIEDYYDVMPEGYNGIIGKAENGNFYEYLTEDPRDPGLIPLLRDNATAVTQALGGAEVAPAGAAIAVAAFPLLSTLGLLGGVAAVAAAANTNNGTGTATITGKLDASTDSGAQGDNKTNDATPTFSGTAPAGASATVTINGQTYPVTINADGTWKFTQPNNLPDGTYYPVLHVTQNGVIKDTNLTPFTIDTTAPTVAVTSNAAALGAGQSATITFTLSEPSADFTVDDVAATGGTLSNWQQSATDPKVYTATFTPTAGSTPGTATISVASGKFNDAAANTNADGAEANNTVSLTTNATTYGALQQAAPNDSGVVGDNKTNDTTPTLSGKVPAGSTASVTINGQKYPVTVNPDGTWSFTNPTNLPDGTYTPVLDVTTNGQTSSTPITPFTIDTTPPTIALASNATTLAAGQTASISFTLSEATSDFSADDIAVTGGTLSNFQKSATDPKVYTATFMPASTGTQASISVASTKFTDAAGNNNADGAEANNSLALTTNTATSGQLSTASDNSTGTPNDGKTNDKTPELTGQVPAGSSATVTINGQTYPVSVNPDGTWSFTQPTDLPDGTYTPQLNVTTNGQTSTTPLSPFTIDTTAPTVAITSAASTLAAGQSATLTFTLSEASADLSDADFAVAGGKLGPLQQSATDPKVYTATFTADAGTTTAGTASVSLASDKFADAAGNLNKDGADANNTWTTAVGHPPAGDTTAPTIIVERTNPPTATLDANGKETITFKLSEASTTFDASDISVTGGTLSNFTPVPTSGTAATGYTQYTAVFTPAAGTNGTGTIGVASGKFTDNAGNLNQDTYVNPAPSGATVESNNQVSVAFDTRSTNAVDNDKPTVQVSIDKTSLSAGQSATLSFILSEATADFTAADIDVISGGGTVSNLQPVAGSNGVQYTATYTAGSTAGTVQIGVDASKFADAAGNTNADTYKGSATGTTAVSNTTAETNNWVSLTNSGSSDTTAPTIAVTRSGTGTVSSTGETIVFTFSEGVATSSFTSADIDATGGTISSLAPVESSKTATGVYAQYTATYTPTTNSTGTGTISVAAGKFADAAGNNNLDTYSASADTVSGHVVEANNQVVLSYNTSTSPATPDTTAPVIAISADKTTLTSGQTATISFTLSEASADFTSADVVVTGGTLSNFVGSGTSYTATYTPTSGSQGTGSVHVDSNAFRDAASNYNQDGADVNNTVNFVTNSGSDTTAPTIAISSNQASLAAGQTATITFTLSEASINFAWNGSTGDINVSGGTLSAIVQDSTNPLVYTATFTPNSNSTANGVISVASNAFTDAANNANNDGADANNTVTLTVNTTTSTSNFTVTNDTNSVTEDGAAINGNVITNDSLATSISKVALSGGTDSTISAGTTSSTGTTVAGTFGSLKLGADGSYTYTIDNTKASVQALKAGDKVTEVFTYTATDGSGLKTANLTITITGTNDAPVAVADVASATEAGGAANATAGTNPTGNVLTNDTDVDTGDTKTVSAIHAGNATGTTGDSAVAAGTATSKAGSFGTISINADGSYTYTVDNTNATVQALLPSSSALTDTFTYTVKDAAGLTSQQTITVSVKGANDAPQVQVALVDQNATTGSSFSYTFAGNAGSATDTFKDVDSGHQTGLTYTATLTDGSSLPSWLSFNASTRTFSGTPPTGTTGPITVKVTASDALGLSTSDDFAINLTAAQTGDVTPPTIVVERANPASSLDAAGTETIIFTLSEASATFDASDIAVTGGTLSNFTPVGSSGTAVSGYTKYTAVFTPTAGATGTATIGVASGKFADMAGNLNQDTYLSPAPTGAVTELATSNTNQVSVAFDTRSTNPVDNDEPTVQVSIDKSTLASGQTATLTFILSEATADFTAADIDVISGGGTVSNLQPVAGSNGVQYTATYTAGSTAGTVQIGVDASKFADAAGNTNADTYKGSATGTTAVSNTTAETNNWVSLTNSGSSDTTAPTIAVTRSGTGTVSSTGETIVFTFSEGVATSSFTSADIDATGGTISSLAPVESSKTATGVYAQYTATYTPTTNSTGTGTISVAAGKFADAAGNNNLDTYSASADTVSGHVVEANNQVVLSYNTSTSPATPDTTAPVIAISADKTTLTSGQTATISFTLSEASADFTSADVVVTGGTLSNFVGSGTSYTATYTPTSGSQGTGSVHVDSNAFRDAASNYNQDGADVNNTVNFVTNSGNNPVVDSTAPTIVVERLGSGTLTSSETIQFTLSEASKDFTLADIAVTGGTLTNLAAVPTSGTAGTGYTTYVATFTPTANSSGQATIGVASGKFSDAAGNTNLDTHINPATAPAVYEANNQVAISYNTINPSPDTTAPTIAVTRAGTSTLQSGGTDTVTFTLSEASLTFEQSDVTITGGGTLSNWSPVAASGSASTGYTVYTATYTPPTSGSGNITIGVKASTFGDAAGNLNKDTFETGIAGTTVESNNQVTVAYNTSATDNVPPTVEVVRSATGTINGAETIYFNFSEATTDFALTDISASGGTMSNLVAVTGTGNKQYTATFTPTANSTTPAAIGVKAGTFSDAAGNLNKDTFDSADTVSGKVVESNNQVTANVDTTGTSPIDETPPTVAISRVGNGAVTSAGDTIVFVFSEPVTGFTLSDVVDASTGSAASGLSNLVAVTGSGNTQFTATYTAPTATVGTVTLGIKAGTFTDAASPANSNKDTYEAGVAGTTQEANNQLTLGWNTDTTTPTVAITSSASTLSGSNTATITFTLSEASADFAQSVIDVAGGSLTNFQKSATDPKVYTATFTPNANSSGIATIGVLGDKFKDLAGNLNKDTYASTVPTGQSNDGNNQASISFDTRNGSFAVSNDSANVGEDGGTNNATAGAALASTTSGVTALNVLSNDSGSSMTVTAVKLSSASSTTAVASGSTSASSFTSITGQYGTLHIGADGSYTYAVDNTNATVQALKGSTNTLSEVFTYSASGSAGGTSQTGNANLTITITGTNDAPVAVADVASATEAGGAANATAGTDPTGNVLTNDTDVDTGDTKTVSAILVGTTGTASNVTAASAAADTTGISGSFGTLHIGTDGSYSYTVNQSNASVQALLPTSTALTDTFTYTVKDAAGATHTNTITVSVKGVNDAPEVQVALVNQSATPDSLLTYPFAGNTGTATDTFKDVDTGHQTGLTYTATLADGSSLPSWLSFNASTRTFSGTPPESAASTTVAVKVTATDALNASTSSNFNIAIGAVPAASVKTALSIDPIATDNVITSAENTGNIAVTGKVTGTFASGDTVTLSINGKTFTGTVAANGTYSINVPASDLAADTDTKIEGSVTGGNGGTLATAAQDYTVEASTTLTKTALSINPVTADNLISNSEPDSNGNIAVTGKVTGKFATGDVVTLSVNGSNYSGTAAADGSYSINVKATDLALDADTTIDGTVTGTGGTLATALQNYGLDTSDTTAPKIAISSNQVSLATGQTATITFTLSEPSADFDGTDIETSGGSLGTLNHVGVNSSGQDIYTASFTPNANSTVNGVVKVASDKFKDAAGNFNKDTYASGVSGTTQETDNTVTLTVNTTSNNTTPAGVKTALSIDPVTGDNVILNSENTGSINVTGKVSGTFAAGDTVTLTINNTAYTGQVAADGSYSITVPATALAADTDTKVEGTVTGTGGDTATAAQDYTLESGNTVTQTALTIDRVTADNTVLASEADTNGNIAITGRVSGKFANGDTVSLVVNGVTSTGTVNSLGFYSINVKATDLLADSDTTIDGSVTGTGGTTATAVQNYALTDLAPPTVAISRAGTGAMTAAETITFTLSEASTTFASTDVDVSGGLLSNWATSDNITYTATFTPTSGLFGSGAIGIKAGTFTDAAGNANKDTYEAFVTGTVLEQNNLLDLSINTDTTPPTVIVSRSTGTTVTGAETITFTLSDNAGTSFDASDIFVTPGAGTLSNFVGDGTVFTATFTPTANSAGSVTIGVKAGKFSDPAGNLNKDTFDSADTVSGKVVETNNAVTFNYKTDNTAPTIAITGPSGAVSGPSTITFTLSEVSSDFMWDPTNPSASTNDIVVTGGGTLSALTPSTTTPGVFTATYTPPSTAGTGTATISVASNKFSDAAGNFNTDGGDTNNSLSVNFDTVTPTVIVGRATNATLGGTGSTAATETITFTLSEASSDFTSTDVVVSAGALSNWTAVSSTVYTATYTPPTGANAATGTATIGVRAGKFQDAAGNQNADDFTLTGGANSNAENNNNVVSVAYDTVAPTQTASFSSMTKDSGLSTGNANWTTADASAGRLVSGFVSAPLGTGETVNVYVDKGTGAVLLGTATVDAGGTTWEYTDTTNYVGATGATGNTAGWTYSAKVVDAAGNAGPTPSTSTQVVNGDYTEAAPVITAARDTASTPVLVGNDPAVTATNPTSTTNAIGSVSGTGVTGNTIYLYDNTTTNLVGSATVLNNGTWTVTGLTGTYSGSNTFSAQQVDALGNQSVLSNLWTVTANSPSLFTNGDFSLGNTGFTTSGVYTPTGTSALTGGIYDDATPDYNVSTSYLSFDQVVTPNATASGTVSGINWTAHYVTGAGLTNPDGAMTGNVMFGGLVTTTPHQVIWSEDVHVVAGQSYVFKFDYWDVDAHLEAAIGGVVIPFFQTTTTHEGGHFTAQFTATTTGPISLAVQGNGNGNGGALGNYALDNFAVTSTATPADNTLVAGGSAPATPNNDTALSYTAGALDALAGNDTITVTSSSLQSTLAAGGIIKGGAGIDTLKLAAGTTLNLETLTGNQTVQKIQEVEILQMQGGSSLTLSANNVLSLGGSNASTMAPFSFSSTQQVADGSTAATGSTSSTGKVQMVIQGGTGDALKLDALATDGVSSAAGVLGNSGLTGTWAYKGQVQIGTITYKVYDHSTTQAQVLVDVPVVVTTVNPIAITAISTDSGTSATDFITNDTSLTYTGTVPVEYNDANHDVLVEILNSSGTVVSTGKATVSGVTWTFDNANATSGLTTLTAGNYTIRSTIVNQGTTTTTSSFGSQGVDTQALVIDTTAPTIAVARANNSTATLSTGQTETITFTLSEASTNFDVSDVAVTGGTLSNFSGSGTSYSATFTPTANTSGTGSISVASSKFSDAAGNQNADGADANNSASVPYVTAVPTQTVTFSSMTKDSSRALDNADWTTADGSAGRLVSGTLDAVLITGQVLKVYSNGSYIGDAVVNGKAWEITDTTGYTAGWTYTAKVEDAAGNTGPTTTRIVNTDFTEAAPVITSVVDSASASIANAGTTSNALSSVSGTGVAGDTIYLYDNTSTNLVGSTVVGANGTWTVSGLNVGAGSNTFSAKQVDALGNESVLSNTWTVSTAGTNLIANGDFASVSAFNSGFGAKLTGADYLASTSNYAVQDTSTWLSVVNTTSSTSPASYTGGTWSKSFVNSTGRLATMTGNMLVGNMVGSGTTWSNTVNVVAGQTYQFSFDYNVNFNTDSGSTSTKGLRVFIDGVPIDVVNTGVETGRFVATYTATTTRSINLSTFSDNTRSVSPNNAGDYVMDNFTFAQTPPASDNSLVAGTMAQGTSGNDTALTFSAGSIDAQAGNDTITVSNTSLQAVLAAGGFIDGGGGVDTLKLAAGTSLDLTALTNNQTVQPIQQVEIFELQGNGSLTLSANDVLSLGGANASTMSAYTFTTTTGGSASASSTGKVQMVINGTSSDALKLKTLAQDGVTTNGLQGNTGLGGEWQDMGTTTIGTTTYHVYNHSTTNAQVLTTLTASTESANVAFTSMTKDSGVVGTAVTNDWRTADGTAGRLVSGTLATALAAGSVVKVYANGTLLGNAMVNAAGTAWEYTDTTAHNANWTYRADVVSNNNVVTGSATQVVTTDFTEVAPVITGVVDAAAASVANNGTTTDKLTSVSGTGNPGDTLYLYDNTSSNLVGTTVVGADGQWSISGLATNTAVGSGINTFSAKQVDAQGNVSVASNLYTVTPTYSNLITNGEFATFNQNFTTTGMTLAVNTTPINGTSDEYQITTVGNAGWTTVTNTNASSGPTTYAKGTWSKVYQGSNAVDASGSAGNPDNAFTGYFLFGQVSSANTRTLWNVDVAIESGKTYVFKFDYANREFRGQNMGVWIDGNFIQFVTNNFESGHFTAIYNATRTGTTNLNITAKSDGNSRWGDFALDNFNFAQSPPLADNSLVAGQPVGASSGANTVAYTSGSVDGVAGDDVITAGTDVQAKLAAGGTINGGAGIDTLKLTAGTTLDLTTLTTNQTVKPIQQVEAFELQGTSTLTLSANDVLSLGQTDAFSGTAGKVQLLIKGTSSDHVALQNLLSDGVGGNSGLAGMWTKEASSVTVSSATYNVYTHSTTGAQVLISAAIPDANVSVSASPLVLDLNGDGVQTLNINLGTQFDLLNSGAKQSVGWVDKHDGLLVMDLNHDGMVNNGSELLGTSTQLADGSLARDGWQALAQYDANADGVIDAQDAAFADLKVWVDANSDGVTEAGELKTLTDVGVQAIQLQHDNAQTTQSGNVLQGFSSFVTTDGQSHQIVDAWLQTSTPAAEAVTFNLVNAKADTLNLNLSDVLKTAANTAGQHVVQVTGDASDTVNLSSLLDTGAVQGSWQASGVVVQGGVTYNAYSHSADASLQVLIDQHITQVHAA